MKKFMMVYGILYLLLITEVNCQSEKGLTHLNNNSISFQILRTSIELIDSNKIAASEILIKTTLSNSDKKKLFRLKYNECIKLLMNETTDWAVNLCLYEIYRRDGSVFEIVKTKEKWRKCCKEKDIAFWKEKLKK